MAKEERKSIIKKVEKVQQNHITVDYGSKVYKAILNKNRRVYLYGTISSISAEALNQKLVAMSLDKPGIPIILEINSGGGSCIAGLSVIDCINSLSCPVYTIVTGYAASMATFISIQGKRRFITKNAYWMAHPISSLKSDYIGFIKDSMVFMKDLEKRCLNMYKKQTKLPASLLKKWQRGEVWLNARQCIKYGVCDEILKKQAK